MTMSTVAVVVASLATLSGSTRADGTLRASPVGSTVQVEIDRLLSRVNGAVITQSDVRRCRALKLVADTSSDESTQRELENRLLTLTEAARVGSVAVTDDALAARRRGWDAEMAGADVAATLSHQGMTDAALQNWLRDDVRIEGYLRRQFGAPGDAGRDAAVATWLARLRQRAGLK
jgi:hypothetical protein